MFFYHQWNIMSKQKCFCIWDWTHKQVKYLGKNIKTADSLTVIVILQSGWNIPKGYKTSNVKKQIVLIKVNEQEQQIRTLIQIAFFHSSVKVFKFFFPVKISKVPFQRAFWATRVFQKGSCSCRKLFCVFILLFAAVYKK